MLLVLLGEVISHQLYPIPHGIDPMNEEHLAVYMKIAPKGAFFIVILGHFIALLIGNVVGLKIGEKHKKVLQIVSGIFLFMVLFNLYMLRHPMWFMILDIGAVIGAYWIPLKLMKVGK